MAVIKLRLLFLWITFSMVVCSIMFLPWFLPRETVSGLMGRWAMNEPTRTRKSKFARKVIPFIDSFIHPNTGVTENCYEIYKMEKECRKALYTRGELSRWED